MRAGGLKSKGHPVGATGVAQICDLVQQIRGEAGERQLARHSLGLAENLGGSGATLRGDDSGWRYDGHCLYGNGGALRAGGV